MTTSNPVAKEGVPPLHRTRLYACYDRGITFRLTFLFCMTGGSLTHNRRENTIFFLAWSSLCILGRAIFPWSAVTFFFKIRFWVEKGACLHLRKLGTSEKKEAIVACVLLVFRRNGTLWFERCLDGGGGLSREFFYHWLGSHTRE